MHTKFNAYSKIILQMPDALEWLSSYDINAKNTRYAKYEEIIKDFFNNDELSKILENQDINSLDNIVLEKNLYNKTLEKFIKKEEALEELLHIYIIFKLFKNERSEGFINRLKIIITGKDLLTNNQSKSRSESRDILFELYIISHFKAINFKIDFNQRTDIVVEKDNIKIYAECKKINSEKSFQKSFYKAGKQLEKLNFTNQEYGLIFIDISNCVLIESIKREVENEQVAKNHIKTLVQDFTNRNNSIINEYNNKFIKHSLAVCFIATIPIWTKDGTQYACTEINIIFPEFLEDNNEIVLNKIFSGFANAFENII